MKSVMRRTSFTFVNWYAQGVSETLECDFGHACEQCDVCQGGRCFRSTLDTRYDDLGSIKQTWLGELNPGQKQEMAARAALAGCMAAWVADHASQLMGAVHSLLCVDR